MISRKDKTLRWLQDSSNNYRLSGTDPKRNCHWVFAYIDYNGHHDHYYGSVWINSNWGPVRRFESLEQAKARLWAQVVLNGLHLG